MYSQNNEEEIIRKELQDISIGRFLDIGAFHPKLLSNTRALYERGWGGVFIEPSPTQIALFTAEYKDCQNIKICDKAISSSAGELIFYISPNDALSTLSTDHIKKWHNVKFQKSTIIAITPELLFDEYGYDFDFIDLDIEGNNWEILQLLPLDKLTTLKLICIEYDNHYSEVISFMNGHGFTMISKNAENVIMSKNK